MLESGGTLVIRHASAIYKALYKQTKKQNYPDKFFRVTRVLIAAYAFAMASATEKKQWAVQACAAAAAARAFGWSAYAKSFSVDLIYKQISSETISAQAKEFFSLLSGLKTVEQKCAA